MVIQEEIVVVVVIAMIEIKINKMNFARHKWPPPKWYKHARLSSKFTHKFAY